MNKVLVLYSSPLPGEKSISSLATKEFIKEYKKNNLNDEIIEFDLNNLEMSINSMNSNNFSSFYNEDLSNKYIEILKETNKLIIAAPMINFNVPTVLKNFIDRVAVANKTFSYKYAKKGSSIGLLNNLKVQIIATQGAPVGWYTWASHVSYLEGVWDFFGASLAKTLLIDGIKVEPFISQKPEEIIETKKDLIISSALVF
ncbi:FMN-dependent NADH-azoreductase [Metamycoplasma canadense]|uniref:FMN dependent NADH:quinone oxidoreductase n=1 Tax=Metamycoplasma canadense TaxID=29554 RepID=A0A077LBQ6_9BACT|nr:FMN-dependent NADH-azoreductase [Metamycoplasma canadense]BAP39564.1 acyl carrier protein phosphodiesterase [Metamycoplasma canadense]